MPSHKFAGLDVEAPRFIPDSGQLGWFPTTAHETAVGITPSPSTKVYQPGDGRRYGVVMNGSSDDTTAWQDTVEVCQKDINDAPTPVMFIPEGSSKCGRIDVSKQQLKIRGVSKYGSKILNSGVNGWLRKTGTVDQFNPDFKYFAVFPFSGTATGLAIDLSAIVQPNFTYNAVLKHLALYSGGVALHLGSIFSGEIDGIYAESYNDHSIVADNGPGASYRNCYPARCGAAGGGKAGYRMTGTINIIGGNGINVGDYWGVFGSNTALANGFQADFAATTYPDILLLGTNLEAFSLCGIRVVAPFQSFKMLGGTFNRFHSSTYHSLVRFDTQPLFDGATADFDGVRALVSGGRCTSPALIYADAPVHIRTRNMDQTPGPSAIVAVYHASAGLTYPATVEASTSDVYNDVALRISAISPRRTTVEVLRYKELIVVPAGSTSIDVTGYECVRIQNTVPTTINNLTFAVGVGMGDVTVTVGAAGAAAGATAVPVAALANVIPNGTVINMGNGKLATLTAPAAYAATSLTVSALPVALVSGDSGRYYGTIGSSDFGRNGRLKLMIEGDSVTIKHLSGTSSQGMKLKAGADYAATKGDVLLLEYSNFYNGSQSGWVQV